MPTTNFSLGYVVPNSAAKEVQVNSTFDQIDAVLETLLTGETATLAGDTDVALSSAGSPPTAIANNDVLTYDTTSGKWKNKPATAGSSTLASDTDVSLAGLSQSDVLHYDTTLSKWVNQPIGWYSSSAGFVYQNLVTDLTSWTAAGTTGTVSSAVEQSSGVTSILEAMGQGNQFNVGSSLANRVISFYVNMPPGNSVGDFLFGCNSSGNGVGLSLSGGYTDTKLITTSSWTPGPPGSGVILTSGWHLIVITIDATGTHASWTYDGTAGETNVAITLSGNYVGLYSNASYGGDFYFSQIQVALPGGESWTSSRTVASGVSTVALTYSGTNNPVFQVPALQLAAAAGAPTSAGTAGTVGQTIAFGGFLYFCSVTGAAGSATWNQLSMTAV